MEKENGSSQNAIDESDSAVQTRVLFVRGQGPHGEAGEDEWHDDQVGSLHDLGRCLLSLVNPGQLPVLGGPRGLNQREGEDGEDDDGDVLGDHESGVHLEPAVVLPCSINVTPLQYKSDMV